MQVVRYYLYLNGEHASTGSRKEKLLLSVAKHSTEQTRDPKVLNAAIAKLLGTDQFCTCDPHLIGKEVFASQKYKADVPLGFESKSHRPNKVNFCRPRIATRSIRTNHISCIIPDVVEELSLELQEDQAPM